VLLRRLMVGLMLLGGDLFHVSLDLTLSGHHLSRSRVLLLAMQHLKKLLLSLPKGRYAMQIET
jgi:hypothetical protein